jgi:hypothetical protein
MNKISIVWLAVRNLFHRDYYLIKRGLEEITRIEIFS